MAYNNFYMQTTGSNLNAGASSANAADATSTNGDWGNALANRFVAASGTPFSATQVGDWASVYLDAATSTTYIAQVTAVNGGGASIDLSSTIKLGTAPATGATGRSCKINGAWASELPLCTTTGMGVSTAAFAMKINIKAGTYTLAASRTISIAGAVGIPLWFSGYNTTPGDLDNDTTNALTKPQWNLTTFFQLTCNGAFQIWSGISFAGVISQPLVLFSGTPIRVIRCRFDNTNTSANCSAMSLSGAGGVAMFCWGRAPATATGNGVFIAGSSTVFFYCWSEGGGKSCYEIGSNQAYFRNCVAYNGVVGFNASNANAHIHHCTIKTMSSHGIVWTSAPGSWASAVSNILSGIGGVGINNSSGTTSSNVFRALNDFHSCTGGNEAGWGEGLTPFGQTESSDPLTSSSDMTPISTSNARAKGGGLFESKAFTDFSDIGAVQHADSGAAGGERSTVFVNV